MKTWIPWFFRLHQLTGHLNGPFGIICPKVCAHSAPQVRYRIDGQDREAADLPDSRMVLFQS
ncbi:MAG: hypothetical protein WCP20_02150 [Desulfuromonadales bacterium]